MVVPQLHEAWVPWETPCTYEFFKYTTSTVNVSIVRKSAAPKIGSDSHPASSPAMGSSIAFRGLKNTMVIKNISGNKNTISLNA